MSNAIQGRGNVPGMGDERIAQERVIYYSEPVVRQGNKYLAAAATDSGSSPTTTIRAGHLLMEDTAGNLIPWTNNSIEHATAQAGGANTITLEAGHSAVDDFYNKAEVEIVAGTGAGQKRTITDYTGSSKVATVNANWDTNPDATSVFVIRGNKLSGLLESTRDMLRDGVAVKKSCGLITSAPLLKSKLFINGAAFVGHADERAATELLEKAGCQLL